MTHRNSKLLLIFSALVFTFSFAASGVAQGPEGRSFGIGVVLNDPTGGTVKVWITRENSVDFYIGGDYFGGPRIGGDYLWNFSPFHSDIAGMYAGVGATVGLGYGTAYWYQDIYGYYRTGGQTGVGVRGICGGYIIPRNTPLEFFLEMGPLIGLTPEFGTGIDVALGMRIYP